MIRDLPRKLPTAVLAAAEEAVRKSDEILLRRNAAKDVYNDPSYRRHVHLAREHLMFSDLPAKAQALVDWGVAVRRDLPSDWLCSRFRTDADFGPCLSVVRHEIVLAEREGFRGGRLTTDLKLVLDPKEGLFRHHEWFDDCRMTGGGLLNTAYVLHMVLHPEMLSQIHELVAEGHVWRRLEIGLNRLVQDFKDR